VSKQQKYLNLSRADGQFYNFLYTPGSINSLHSHLKDGWIVKEMHLNHDDQSGFVLFERGSHD